MMHVRMSNKADVGDMVRHRSTNKLYLIIKIDSIVVNREVISNTHPYSLIDIENGIEHDSFVNLDMIQEDYILEARCNDMTIMY